MRNKKSTHPILLAMTVLGGILSSVDITYSQPRGGYTSPYGYRSAGTPGYSAPRKPVGFIRGSVVLSPEEKGGEEIPGAGVMVRVITLPESESAAKAKADTSGTVTITADTDKKKKAEKPTAKSDTLYATVGESGTFFMRDVPVGKAYVEFSMVGYKTLSNTMNVQLGDNKVVANLQPVTQELEAAVVKETVQPLSIKGDTVVFHASAVKTNKGEMAIDILEQMPGVEVSESSVKVLNEDVKNVYIDGALLFGSAPMKALTNLSAEEVISIKSYQEYDNKDPRHKISKTEEKQRVLDIETKSKPKMVYTGNFISGGGFDTDTTYRKFRYTLGGQFHAFSQGLQVHATANVNNINDSSNSRRSNTFRSAGGGGDNAADLRAISVSASINRRWMSKETKNFELGSLSGSYSHSNNYTVTESLSEQIYFPSEQFTSRKTENSSQSESTSKSHNFSLGANKSLPDGRISLSGSYSLSDGLTSSRNTSYNYQDDLPRQGTSSSTRRTTDGNSYNVSLGVNKRFWNKLGVNASASMSQSGSDGFSHKIDTTTSTITYKVIDIDSSNPSTSRNLNASIRYELSDYAYVRMSGGLSSSYRETDQWAYDVTDPASRDIDTVNTHHYTYDNNNRSAGLHAGVYFEKIKANLRGSLEFNSVSRNRSEHFPEDYTYDRRFNSWNPSLTFGTESMLNRWNIGYSSGASTPSIEQLRPKLDNSSLYSVTAGNPDLRQSISHQFRLSYSTCLGREVREAVRASERGEYVETAGNVNTLGFNASFTRNTDNIVNRRTYYTAETYLPQYSYTMPAQSTLTTYENVKGSSAASASVYFDAPIEKIMWNLTSSVSMNWDESPSYVNDILTLTENFRPSVRLGLRSNFSRNVRINISGSGSYIYSNNTQKDETSYFSERLNVGAEFNNILKYFYVGGNYTKSFMQGIEYKNVNDNILNLNAGLRGGPKNNIDFSVSVHDLFNKTSGFSTSMNSNFIRNSWTHNFGRYVMFTLTYRFNSMRGASGRIGGPSGDRGGSYRPSGGIGGPGGYSGGMGGPGGGRF